jgi:hypothetical protein
MVLPKVSMCLMVLVSIVLMALVHTTQTVRALIVPTTLVHTLEAVANTSLMVQASTVPMAVALTFQTTQDSTEETTQASTTEEVANTHQITQVTCKTTTKIGCLKLIRLSYNIADLQISTL